MHIIPADYRGSTADECELYTSRLCPKGKQLTKLNKTSATRSENSHITSPTPRKPKLVLNLSVKGGWVKKRKEISLDLSSSFSSALQPSATSQGVHLSLLSLPSASSCGLAPVLTTSGELSCQGHQQAPMGKPQWLHSATACMETALASGSVYLPLLPLPNTASPSSVIPFLTLPPYPFSNAPASHGSNRLSLLGYGSVAFHLHLYSLSCSTASLPRQYWESFLTFPFSLRIPSPHFLSPLFRFFGLKIFYGRYYYSSRYYVYHFSFIIMLLSW